MPISMMFPFCRNRLGALKYGCILHIALDSPSEWSSEVMGLHNLETTSICSILVVKVIDMDGRDEVRSRSYRIGIPWPKLPGLASDWR